jgi:hypothetical protein
MFAVLVLAIVMAPIVESERSDRPGMGFLAALLELYAVLTLITTRMIYRKTPGTRRDKVIMSMIGQLLSLLFIPPLLFTLLLFLSMIFVVID